MSARKGRGNAGGRGACAATPRAAALMTASRNTWRSTPMPAPSGQASACKPSPTAYVPLQGFEATAPAGGLSRARRAEAVPNEAAPSGRSTHASIALVLFPIPGGLTMAKTAPSFFYDLLKSVPLGGIQHPCGEVAKTERNPLFLRNYTLCEVTEVKRQFVPWCDYHPTRRLSSK